MPGRRLRRLVLTALILGAASTLSAQLKVQPVAEHPSETALRLALRQLRSIGTFMQTTAHPDDEDNGLLALMAHGRGMRSVLLTATRGDGGQNEIGPELFQALSVLRTEEVLAAHRFDGAEQFFTRAVDFGYSFSVDETLRLWGHEEILGDFVRLIRAVRPDVIAAFLCGGGGGGQHHQASTRLTREAFRASADATRFPEQIAGGLRPWQARRLFCTDFSSFMPSSGDRGSVLLTTPDVFEPLLGRPYGELGIEARSMHKCQGTSQLIPLPGQSFARSYRLEESLARHDGPLTDFFDGIDTSLAGLVQFAGGPHEGLSAGLREIAASVAAAERAVDAEGPSAAAPPLATGLQAVRRLRGQLGSMSLGEPARFEIDFRLEQKERQFEKALTLAYRLRLEVLADDGLVTSGQPIKISVLGQHHAPAALELTDVSLSGFSGAVPACSRSVRGGEPFRCDAAVAVAETRLTTPYWQPRGDAARYDFDADVPFGVPFRPSPFRARISLTLAGVPVVVDRAVEYRYDHVMAGEKRMELHVVPSLAVSVGPEIVVIPAGAVASDGNAAIAAARQIEVTVINHQPGAARGTVALKAPGGWRVTPARAPVAFTRQDESTTVKFTLAPPPTARAGEYAISAGVEPAGAATPISTRGYEVIEYQHVHRRHLVKDAATRLKIIDVTVPAGLNVGYVMGVGDQVPQAIEQLGATVRLIGPDELASGDLARYDVIVTGVRAYERRPDLRANNDRLLQFVAAGGTVLVQYNKFEFNAAQYGPFPAKVGANRVTDETAPVDVLVPDHPVFTSPNRIGAEAWQGWVQERGLYFLGERDPRYVDLIQLTDPFDYNPGRQTGALVEARIGKGRWLYLGLGLWRQLPAGTDGAYRLLANLLALGRTP